MVTGPRPTPHPIVLHVNDQGNPVRLAESSSIYVTTVSAVTISATNYLGLEVSGGVPGGDLSSLQFKTGNTTFNGSPFLKYSPQLSGLLANAVSATRVLVSNLSATTISATTYLNLPGTNLSSLLDVQYASVSGGQALVYSSSINKWAPGYRVFRSNAIPVSSVGIDGDIYFQYINDSTNAAYLSSLLDTNINLLSNGQSLIWSSGYWIASSLPIAQGAITNIPSASPIWNAASAEGYDIQWGAVGGFAPAAFDILGFSIYDTPVKVTNYRVSAAGPLLAQYTQLNDISDLDVGNSQTNDILAKRSDGYWASTSSINIKSISATNWQGLPSATPIWNANKISNLPVNFSNLQSFDLLGVDFSVTQLVNFPATTAATFLVGQVGLSALSDVDTDIAAINNDTLVYVNGYWTPSNSISLLNVSATTVRAVDLFGTRANITNVSATTVSSTNLSAINARITGLSSTTILTTTVSSTNLSAINAILTELSATTISATNWKGLPSATAYWNAASATGYAFDFTNETPEPTDILGFGFGRIQNFRVSAAGPFLAPYISFSSLRDASSISVSSIVAVSADLSSVKLSKYVEPKSTVTISSSSITLNLNNAQVFEISATSNISSITIQNPDSRSSIVQGFTIIFSADGTQRTVTNWGSIKWSGGTGPTLTATNNKKDILSFISPDNGTNWYGFIGGQNF